MEQGTLVTMANQAHLPGVPVTATLNLTRFYVVVGASSRRDARAEASFRSDADSAGNLSGVDGAAHATSLRRQASTRTSLTLLDFHHIWGKIADVGGDGINGIYRLSESVVGVISTEAVNPKFVSITWPFRKLIPSKDVVVAASRGGFECWEWQVVGITWAKSDFCESSLSGQGDDVFVTCNCTRDGLYAPVVAVTAQKFVELTTKSVAVSGSTDRVVAREILALSLSWMAVMVFGILGVMVYVHRWLEPHFQDFDWESTSHELCDALLDNSKGQGEKVGPSITVISCTVLYALFLLSVLLDSPS
jgi:hypothetical protein